MDILKFITGHLPPLEERQEEIIKEKKIRSKLKLTKIMGPQSSFFEVVSHNNLE